MGSSARTALKLMQKIKTATGNKHSTFFTIHPLDLLNEMMFLSTIFITTSI
jgi:hypothetical protein